MTSPTTCFSEAELRELGVHFGTNVHIDRTCRFYGTPFIRIASHVRIDAFTVITADGPGVVIGNYVHIGAHGCIMGRGGVELEDFTNLSARVSIFSTNDDYTGGAMTNPTVPEEYRRVTVAPIVLRRHAIVGCGSVLLPGVELGVAASVGALTLVKKSVPDFAVVFGHPMRQIGTRDPRILDLERQFRDQLSKK